MTYGFVLGKFMPPHNGHVLLCDFASAYTDRLTVLVCSLPSDPISGELRRGWMAEMFPHARVLHLDRPDVPQLPEDHPAFWDIWRQIVKQYHPEPIDFLFASESYGERLAIEVGARFVPFERSGLAISGTAIRADPFTAWDFIPAVVRPHYAKRVCVFGPESTGKTTLAVALAQQLKTICVAEYGRIYTEAFGVECNNADLLNIAAGHIAATAAALKQANRLVVCDTDPVLTSVWSDMLLDQRDPWFETFKDYADLYLLTDIDMPWIDDGTRYFANAEQRAHFFELCRTELDRRKLPYVLLSGSHEVRLKTALQAIAAQFPPLPKIA